MRVRKKELGDWRENGSEYRDAAKTQLPSHEVCGKLDEYEREEQWVAKQRKRMAVLRNNHTHRSLNPFNERFAIPFLILASHFRCTWTTGLKACGTPTNTNMHVSVQRLLRYVHARAELVRARHTLRICILSYKYQRDQASKRGKNSRDYNFDSYIANTVWQKFVMDRPCLSKNVPEKPHAHTPCCTDL